MRIRITAQGTIDESGADSLRVELPSHFTTAVTFSQSPSNIVSSVSINTNITSYLTLVNVSSGEVTVTLPDAIVNEGKQFNVKKTDSSAYHVVIVGSSNQTIDGTAELIITSQWTTTSMIAHDGAWFIL